MNIKIQIKYKQKDVYIAIKVFFDKESSVDLHKKHSSGKNALIIISQGTLKI